MRRPNLALIAPALCVLSLSGCEVTPDTGDTEVPTLSLAILDDSGDQIFSIVVFPEDLGNPSGRRNNCPPGTAPVVGIPAVEVPDSAYPLTVVFGVIDGGGVADTFLNVRAGTFSRALPTDVLVREQPVSGTGLFNRSISRAYGADEALTLRELRIEGLLPAEEDPSTPQRSINIAVTAEDFAGNATGTQIQIGDRGTLCR